jgi:alpha-tubulin suppressor-like RCC1 family protein
MAAALFGWRAVALPEPATKFYASYYHNLAIGSKTGSVYSWGCGTFIDGNNDGIIPALGQGNNAKDTGAMPQKVLGITEGAVAVDGGAYHSVIQTVSGRVLTFGASQLGQLGRADFGGVTDGAGLPVDPKVREVEGLPKDDAVKAIAAGFYNTLVACKSGSLFCSGENQNQQCGNKGKNNLRTMHRISELSGEKIVQASGGYCHTLALTVDGRVLTLGCSDDGQRGDGKDPEDSRSMVTEARLPSVRAVQVSAGANHSVVLGSDGNAYSCGSNEFGQCGVASKGEEDAPVLNLTRVPLPNNAGRVVKVSTGYAHTVLQDELGKLYTFGQNEGGQLAQGAAAVETAELRAATEALPFPGC